MDTGDGTRIESLEDVWRYIREMDLAVAERKLRQPLYGIPLPQEAIDHAMRDYRRFLFLCRQHEDEPLSPTVDIDLVWHEHILNTRAYVKDSAAIFGDYLHHEPNGASTRREAGASSFQRTRRYYRAQFGEDLSSNFEHDRGQG